MKRRTFLKKMVGSFLTLIGVSGSTYYYAKYMEPSMLTIQKEIISSSKIPSTFNQFKIVQFSDTHIGFHYTLEQFDQLIEEINKLQPDIVVFTGDLVDQPNKFKHTPSLTNLLKKVHAPYGKYWIYGNHDHGGYGTEIIREVMKQSNFQLLMNEHKAIENNYDRINLVGVDDAMLGKPDLSTALQQANSELFTILLAHEPDFADVASQYSVDIQLSGHSHGGQVRVPFIGHLYTPAMAEKYVQGKYELEDHHFILYVSKGIGTTRMPYRFLCKPEIHLFELQRA